jgi:hypothetical protein
MELAGSWITEDHPMDGDEDQYDQLLQVGAQRLKGHQRRLFQAEICLKLCDGNARLERSATLPKYDITITPKKPRGR